MAVSWSAFAWQEELGRARSVPDRGHAHNLLGGAARRAAQEHIAEWTGLMERHTPQARQVLRKLLHGRVTVQPTPEREDCYAEITATATFGRVLEGSAVRPHVLASPPGNADCCTSILFDVLRDRRAA